MAKRKARAGKSSLFASLPQELRQTITSSLTTQVLIPTAPSSAPSPSSSSAPVSEAGPSSLKRSAPESAQEDVVIKRRKAWSEEDERQGRKHPWDCEGLVERYDKSKRVPLELRKYYAQRHRMFSMYDELPLLLDHEGWYSVTPERIAIQIAERLRCGTVLDAFCGVGGNSIAFAQTCERVIALDINPTRLALARHNAFQYGVADRIEFILCDFVSFARQLAAQQAKTASSGSSTKDARPLGGIDVVFLSPPWGGISYLSVTEPTQPSTLQIEPSPSSMTPSDPTLYPLSALAPLHGKELFELARGITQDVAYYLPRNSDLEECAALADEGEQVEVEEEWMGSKLKAITVLYGGLPKKVKEARGTEVES